MKTRIIHTKVHFQDNWFYTLPIEYKYLFIYLFTNSYIGMTGIYELPDRVIILETGVSKELWEKAKKRFQKDKKAGFYKGWVCIVNAIKYANYSGPKNEVAYKRELASIPKKVLDYFSNTLSIPYIYPSDTTINNKSKIINNKYKEKKEELLKKISVPF